MILCPYCQYYNTEGILFCEDCGTPLVGSDIVQVAANSTHQLRAVQESQINKLSPESIIGGTVVLRNNTNITIRFEKKDRLTLPEQAEIVFGRSDERTQTYPDIDLTPYGALEKGVSRIHATMRRQEDSITLSDLGSANGTFLNGKQLIANHSHLLRDGDEIQFGKLVAHIFFQ